MEGGGILILRKEPGLSSNGALQRVRRLLGGVKAGHAGTLDPGAEGVLLVCAGGATRIVPFLSCLDKEYLGRMRFGEETETLDAEGEVVARAPVDHLSSSLVEERMGRFRGPILQKPPMYSAVKVGGRRLYEIARKGRTVEREPREVLVKEFELLEWEAPEMTFRVRCGGGTYVRSLCHDLARECGSAGHMTSLTRTAIGPFRLEDALRLEELEEVLREGGPPPLVAPDEALAHLPVLPLDEPAAALVRQGRRLAPPEGVEDDIDPGRAVRLTNAEGVLVAVVRYLGPGVPMPIERVVG